jgi:hypothetical protein
VHPGDGQMLPGIDASTIRASHPPGHAAGSSTGQDHRAPGGPGPGRPSPVTYGGAVQWVSSDRSLGTFSWDENEPRERGHTEKDVGERPGACGTQPSAGGDDLQAHPVCRGTSTFSHLSNGRRRRRLRRPIGRLVGRPTHSKTRSDCLRGGAGGAEGRHRVATVTRCREAGRDSQALRAHSHRLRRNPRSSTRSRGMPFAKRIRER